MPPTESERVHSNCPTCQCEPKRLGRVILYPPNRLLYGECGTCGKVRWASETWAHHRGSWTPTRREHCGCCKAACPTHTREALAQERVRMCGEPPSN